MIYTVYNNVYKYPFKFIDYLDIVNVLKNKIEETEQLITIKKSAKQEFAYSLSKNLLKAISNLSVEVMSLN
jgi:hypothetical protein